MLWTPSTPVGRGRIASDAGLDFPDGQMTVDMRLFLNPRPSGFQRIVSKYDQQDDATRCWECLVLDDGKLQFKVNLVDPTTGTGSDVTVETHDPLPIQKWLHVAAVFDRPNKQMRILVDGKVSGQTPIPDRPMRMNAKQDIYVGRNAAWQWHYFDGKIDELQAEKEQQFAEGDDASNKLSNALPETVGTKAFRRHRERLSDSHLLRKDRYPLTLSNASADVLGAGAPGFGRALDLSLDRDHPRCVMSIISIRNPDELQLMQPAWKPSNTDSLRILIVAATPADILDQSAGTMSRINGARGDWVGCVVLTRGDGAFMTG